MRSDTSRGGLIWIAAAIFLLAAGIWKFRRPHTAKLAQLNVAAATSQPLTSGEARQLLTDAFQANDTQNYTADINSKVFVGGKWYQSQAQIAKAPGEMTLSYLSGEGNGLQCGYNQNWAWRKSSPSLPLEPYAHLDDQKDHLDILFHNYQVDWKGISEINKRIADVLEITPRYPLEGGGPAKRIWVDRASKLPLRIETFNHRLMPVMRSSLSNLNFPTQVDPASFIKLATIQQALQQTPWTAYQMGDNFEEAGRLAGLYPPLPNYLPAGFIREGVAVHRCSTQDDGCYAASSRYTDGINTLTLFAIQAHCAQQLQIGQPLQTQQSHVDGRISVFGTGTVTTRSSTAGTLVAIADFPPTELLRVLNSIQIRPYSVTTELNGMPAPASNE